MPIIEFQDAIIKRGTNTILNHINFALNGNEHWAIIGPSGSGKTSFLEAFLGKVYLNGKKIYNPLKANKEIAIIPSKPNFKNLCNLTSQFYYQQRYHAYESEESLTVKDHLSQLREKSNENNFWNFTKVSELLDLKELSDRHLIKLSNGESKRLLIAEALIQNPKLLLMDNPLTGLDKETKAKFNTFLSHIIEQGIQVILTTEMNAIPPQITHVAILGNGQILEQIPQHQIQHLHRYYKAYVPDVDVSKLSLLLKNNYPEYQKLISLKDIRIIYDGKAILEDVNWQVSTGERWHLKGHNGAGKSTLLSLINGDNPQAYANQITLFDQDRRNLSIWDIKRRIGFVSPELFQNFPNYNNCAAVVESGLYETLGLFKPSIAKNRKLALEWMSILGIEEFQNFKLNEVSDSTKRLVLLGRAMIKQPELLILDEPCQGLDQSQKSRFIDLVDRICQNSNITVIYVSHNEDDVPSCIVKEIELKNGQVVN